MAKTCQYRRRNSHESGPWAQNIPWRRKWQPIPLFLPGKSLDRGTWWAMAQGVSKIIHDWACIHIYLETTEWQGFGWRPKSNGYHWNESNQWEDDLKIQVILKMKLSQNLGVLNKKAKIIFLPGGFKCFRWTLPLELNTFLASCRILKIICS